MTAAGLRSYWTWDAFSWRAIEPPAPGGHNWALAPGGSDFYPRPPTVALSARAASYEDWSARRQWWTVYAGQGRVGLWWTRLTGSIPMT